MCARFLKFGIVVFFTSFCISAFSQEVQSKEVNSASIIDSLKKNGIVYDQDHKKPEISLSVNDALKFLKNKMRPQIWNDAGNNLRQAFDQLIFESTHPLHDSIKNLLLKYPYDSINIPWDKFYIWEPLKVKMPVSSVMQNKPSVDSISRPDTGMTAVKTDSLRLKTIKEDTKNNLLNQSSGSKDTTFLVVIDTIKEVPSSRLNFPFRYYNYPYQSDSIKAAVTTLLHYLDERDSSIINFTGIDKTLTPVWLNSKVGNEVRYWLRNEFSDSVTVWIGNPSRNTIGLYLEQGVNFRRPPKQSHYSKAKVNAPVIDNSKLLALHNITIKPRYWKYKTDASFILNQASLSNWVSGGESNISTALDITGYADYDNKDKKLSSNNYARLKFGYLATTNLGLRKNLDQVETSSKLNHKAFGKFDFSGILLFKTQVAVGKNYYTTKTGKDSATMVSKFLNPGTLTIGFGLDYKPIKTLSLNVSPLSYKLTFVTDTVRIDQTKYGIAKNRKALNEPGASVVITSEIKPISTIVVTNRIQLFTNYIHNPQNVDVDWEMIATAHLNWFTDIRLNTHLIFDDDTKTAEVDRNGKTILRADGTEKKTARIQFKETLGLSLAFHF